jgi:hypothetical protein
VIRIIIGEEQCPIASGKGVWLIAQGSWVGALAPGTTTMFLIITRDVDVIYFSDLTFKIVYAMKWAQV